MSRRPSPAAVRAFAPELIAQLVAAGRVGIVAAIPEECLLNGLKAALEAAKGEV